MKGVVYTIILAAILAALASCQSNSSQGERALVARLDSIDKRLDSVYAPGLGEFMSSIQVHHAKLWFAGTKENWALADFEIHEIGESLDDIRQYCKNRPEVASLPMINPPLDSLGQAIKDQDVARFRHSFLVLTQTCNTCHQATQHGFNVVKVPTIPPFDNQEYGK